MSKQLGLTVVAASLLFGSAPGDRQWRKYDERRP
jgi:hypothetical protein